MPSTAAAPDMSYFMSSMFCAGLIEMPPVSNVTPLPTRTTGAPSAPLYSRAMKRGSSTLPCATARSAPICSLTMAALSSTVTPNPWRPAISVAARGHVGRRADVAGEDLDASCQRLARADGRADPVAARDRIGVGRREQVDPLENGLLLVRRALHLVELPHALRQTLGDRLTRLLRRDRAPCLGREMERRRGNAERSRALGGDRGGPPDGAAGHLVGLAESHEEHPCRRAGRDTRTDELVALAAEIAGRQQAAERAAGGLVELGERAGQRAPRDRERQQRSLMTQRSGGDDGGVERHRSREE